MAHCGTFGRRFNSHRKRRTKGACVSVCFYNLIFFLIFSLFTFGLGGSLLGGSGATASTLGASGRLFYGVH